MGITENKNPFAAKSPALRVTNIVQTCGACPSQWEGKVEDGRMIYIRYRHGYLSIEASIHPSNDVDDAIGEDCILGLQHGDNYDGVMDFEDLVSLSKEVLDFSNI